MRPKRVLIIDDDRSMCDLIAAIVMNQGYRPTTSYDVENGLMGFTAGLYDLVISDIYMKGVGGIEGIGRIRKIDQDIPIIAISGGYNEMSSEKTVLAAQKIGANHGLTKPFEPDELLAVITQALDTGA